MKTPPPSPAKARRRATEPSKRSGPCAAHPRGRGLLRYGWVLAALSFPFLAQADILVTNSNSNGAGSLADAITQANAAPGSTITFAITNSTITLTAPLPAINASVTVNGGTGNTVSGNNAVQVFFVNSGTVAINNLTIVKGKARAALEALATQAAADRLAWAADCL